MIDPKINSLLVADDDMDDLMLLLEAIETCSQTVNISHVSDGAELLTFLKSEVPPELILLDINMAKIGGIDCLKSIKSSEKFQAIPIIMYSTSSNREQIEECFQLGASRYIIKPFKFDDIVKFMEIILSTNWQESKVVARETFVIS